METDARGAWLSGEHRVVAWPHDGTECPPGCEPQRVGPRDPASARLGPGAAAGLRLHRRVAHKGDGPVRFSQQRVFFGKNPARRWPLVGNPRGPEDRAVLPEPGAA